MYRSRPFWTEPYGRPDFRNRPADQIFRNRPAGQMFRNRPAGQILRNRPAGQITPNRPAGQITPNRPAGQITLNRPAGQTGWLAGIKIVNEIRVQCVGAITSTWSSALHYLSCGHVLSSDPSFQPHTLPPSYLDISSHLKSFLTQLPEAPGRKWWRQDVSHGAQGPVGGLQCEASAVDTRR